MTQQALLENELIVAVDFDGTITENPEVGQELQLKENCREVLTNLYEQGVLLVLNTCRSGSSLNECLQFLKDSGLTYVFTSVNEQIPELKKKYHPNIANKIGADLYIDDKNYPIKEINWLEIENYILGGI